MDLDLSTEHHEMAALVRSVVGTVDAVNTVSADRVAGGDQAVYDALVETQITGMLVPDADGGLGLGPVESAVVLEPLGTRPTDHDWVAELVAVPLALTALTPTSGEPAARLRAGLLAGTERSGFAWERAAGVIEAAPLPAAANEIVVLGQDRVGLAPASAVVPTGRRDLLGRPGAAALAADTVTWHDVGSAAAASCLAHARVAAAAFALGAGEAALGLAVEHAKARHQFGRPIGSFQAVKHRLAAARIALTFARPLVLAAAWAGTVGSPTAGRDAAAALLRCGAAAGLAARAALQVHGAIGYTAECRVGGLLTQIRVTQDRWGPVHRLREELATALEAPAGPIGAGADA